MMARAIGQQSADANIVARTSSFDNHFENAMAAVSIRPCLQPSLFSPFASKEPRQL